MPYLPIDLDGKRKWPLIATGCSIPVEHVTHGFVELWEMVWRTKRDWVTLLQLECLFKAPGERVGLVLAEFDFLGLREDGTWRVLGAAEWLNVPLSNSENGAKGGKKTAAGKKSLSNLKQNRIGPTPPDPIAKSPTEAPISTDGTEAVASVASDENTEATEASPKRNPKPFHPAPSTQHPSSSTSRRRGHATATGASIRAEKPTRPEAAWDGQDFERWFQWKRQEDAGLVPEVPQEIFALGEWWDVALPVSGGDVRRLMRAVIAFAQKPHWQQATPPLPFRAFMSQYRDFLPPAEVKRAHG